MRAVVQVSFSCAFLVTFIVSFVLIPGIKKQGLPVVHFFKFFPLLFHNANIMLMITDTLLSKTKFCLWHFPFAVLFGCCYVVFQWYWFQVIGVFYYFFLDYHGSYAVLWHLGLIVVVSVCCALNTKLLASSALFNLYSTNLYGSSACCSLLLWHGCVSYGSRGFLWHEGGEYSILAAVLFPVKCAIPLILPLCGPDRDLLDTGHYEISGL